MAIFVKNDSRDIFGIDETKTKKVTVLPMSDEQIELCENIDIERKHCFQNAYEIVMNNPDRFEYVLGAGDIGLAYEHAFIKDIATNTYFDPTGHIALGRDEPEEMYVIKEFSLEELSNFVVSQGDEAYPPDFATMSKLKQDMDLFITASQYFKSKKENDNSLSL